MGDQLLDSDKFRTWLKECIQKKHPQAVLKDFEAVPLGPESAVGYMSTIRRLLLEWESDDASLPKSLVLKRPSSEGGMNAVEKAAGESMNEQDAMAMLVFQTIAHDTETAFLQMFEKEINHNVKAPELYGGQSSASGMPCILMKDYKDTKLVDITTGLNEHELFAVVDQLVELHVFSFTNENWKAIEEGEEKMKMMSMFLAKVKMMANNLAAEYPEHFSGITTFMNNTFGKDENWLISIIMPYMTNQRVTVVVHGDLWTPQILWKDGEIQTIVDWQQGRKGSVLDDFLHLLTTCTSAENRKRLQTPLLDHYYKNLVAKLADRGQKAPFSREFLDEELKFLGPYTCLWTIFATSFWANSLFAAGSHLSEEDSNTKKTEAFRRCKSYLEEVLNDNDWA